MLMLNAIWVVCSSSGMVSKEITMWLKKWYRKSAEQGNETAKSRLESLNGLWGTIKRVFG